MMFYLKIEQLITQNIGHNPKNSERPTKCPVTGAYVSKVCKALARFGNKVTPNTA